MLRICYFGTYSMEEGYPRNRVIIEGLQRNGVDVIECHEDLWRGTEEKLEGVKDGYVIFKKLFRFFHVYVKLIKKFRKIGNFDALIVGYAGHIDIFIAKALNLFRKKPLIFDAFLSLYDTAVLDRKIVPPDSLKAKLIKLVDTWSCRIADAVLLDTQAHIDYFVKEFGLTSEKFFAVPVGSSLPVPDSSPLHSIPPLFKRGDLGDFNVLYFGSYIPLHGVDIILKAAKILQDKTVPTLSKGGMGGFSRDVVFILIGKGQLLPQMKELASNLSLKNAVFIDRFVGEEELARYIQQADICLGIFGQTEKASRVIPCKVYNCLAMGRPVITASTPATEGIFTHRENAFLCRAGDPEDLAEAILSLKKDEVLREGIASHGQDYFHANFSIEAIGERVRRVVVLTSKP